MDCFSIVDRSGRDSIQAGLNANKSVLTIEDSATAVNTRLSGDTSKAIGFVITAASEETARLVAHHAVRSAMTPPSMESRNPSMSS